MDQQDIFREILNDAKTIAAATGNVLTVDEIKDLFKEITLTEEQINMVFQYLISQGIGISGYEPDRANPFTAIEQTLKEQEEDAQRDASQESGPSLLELYLKEMDEIKPIDFSREKELYEQAAAGSKEAIQQLILNDLSLVTDLAGELENETEYVEDLIQEGNMELIHVLNHLEKADSYAGYQAQVMNAISKAMHRALKKEQNEKLGKGPDED